MYEKYVRENKVHLDVCVSETDERKCKWNEMCVRMCPRVHHVGAVHMSMRACLCARAHTNKITLLKTSRAMHVCICMHPCSFVPEIKRQIAHHKCSRACVPVCVYAYI
jgi:hypothetical protein